MKPVAKGILTIEVMYVRPLARLQPIFDAAYTIPISRNLLWWSRIEWCVDAFLKFYTRSGKMYYPFLTSYKNLLTWIRLKNNTDF